MLDIY